MEETSEKKIGLTVDNWAQASDKLKMRMRKLGDAGKEIRSGVREQVAPVRLDQVTTVRNERLEEVQVRAFDVDRSGALTRAGEIAYAEAVKAYHKKIEGLISNRQKAISMMMESLSEDLESKVRTHVDFPAADGADDALGIWQIIEQVATGQGAHSISVDISQLLKLKQDEDYFGYVREFRRLEGSLKKKEGDPAKLLESILDGIFVLGLNRMDFPQLKEMLGKQVWTTRAQLSEELGRYLTTTERITAVMLKKEEGAVNANSVKFKDQKGDKHGKMKWVCYNCGGNHGKMKCSKGPQVCGKCGRSGHIAKFCRCLGGPVEDDEDSESDEEDEPSKRGKAAKGKKAGLSANALTIQEAWSLSDMPEVQ